MLKGMLHAFRCFNSKILLKGCTAAFYPYRYPLMKPCGPIVRSEHVGLHLRSFRHQVPLEHSFKPEPPTKWVIRATNEATGREAHSRTVDFLHTGNNEGEFTKEVEVKEADGTVIATTKMCIDWEYHGGVHIEFSEAGDQVTLNGSDGQTQVLELAS